MDLTPIEQWQVLAWLRYQNSLRSLLEEECLALHLLLLQRVGDNYQQIICEPPAQPIGELTVQMNVDTLVVVSADILPPCTIGATNCDLENALALIQAPIVFFKNDVPAHLNSLCRCALAFAAGLPMVVPGPLENTATPEGRAGRKWRKFRRDPALFFRDFFGKWF